jgi:3D (Asp-Asp-Asp) domain-containing protein
MKNIMNIINIIKNSSILKRKISFSTYIFVGSILTICLLSIAMPRVTMADPASISNASYVAKATNVAEKAIKTVEAVMTAYSSTPDQTDDSPFTTASNKQVRDGIIANNMLPFGTKIRIPELYGDKIFVVEDRMNKRMGNHRFDIWMPDRSSALKFGVKSVTIEVLES